VNRNNFYGFVNRDYYSIKQDIARSVGRSRLRRTDADNQEQGSRSVLDYIGNASEAPNTTNNPRLTPQSRYRSPRTSPSDGGDLQIQRRGLEEHGCCRHRILAEMRTSTSMAGLSSEALPGGNPGGNVTGVSIYNRNSPLRTLAAIRDWSGCDKIAIDNQSGYLIDTANYNDFIF